MLDQNPSISRPVLRYHGGKYRLAPWIIQHLPPHRVYTEPFGGAASVLMRKERASLVEVYNDKDGEIVSLFKVLRDPTLAKQLAMALQCTPFAREEFQQSYEPADDVIEQARRTVCRAFMGLAATVLAARAPAFERMATEVPPTPRAIGRTFRRRSASSASASAVS